MNHSDAGDLLATSRELLLKQLLPVLPANLHYEARMIASAMAIAAREIELAAVCAQVELEALARIYYDVHGLTEAALTQEQAQAQVVRDIRKGVYDERGRAQDLLLEALVVITREQLKISNPKVLAHG